MCGGCRRAFQHYVSQDAYFLKFFARAYGIALSKALALDDETFATLGKLLRGVHDELKVQRVSSCLTHMRPAAHSLPCKTLETLEHTMLLWDQAPQQPTCLHYQTVNLSLRTASDMFRTRRRGQRGQRPQLHGSYASRWGVDLEASSPSAATLAYTDFLMEVAESHGEVRGHGVTQGDRNASERSGCATTCSSAYSSVKQDGVAVARYGQDSAGMPV